MKFLKKKSPERKNKWYLAYIYLKKFREEKKFRSLKLKYFKSFSFTIRLNRHLLFLANPKSFPLKPDVSINQAAGIL